MSRNLKENRRWVNLLQSKPVLVFLGILLLVSAWSIVGFLGKMEETKKNKKMAEEKVAELEQSKLKLEADINKLETDRGVEEVLREDFGMAKEGEGLIVVVDEDPSKQKTEDKMPGGFMSFFKNLFK